MGMYDEDRPARAARLRPRVAAAVERMGVRQVHEATGVLRQSIEAFLRGSTPMHGTLDAFDEWGELPSARAGKT